MVMPETSSHIHGKKTYIHKEQEINTEDRERTRGKGNRETHYVYVNNVITKGKGSTNVFCKELYSKSFRLPGP